MPKWICKAICCVTLFLAIASMAVGTALAEYVSGYFSYDSADGSVTITGYSGTDEVVTVPAMIAGKPVNVIAKGAFNECLEVREVRVHTSVVEVQPGALAPGQTLLYVTYDGKLLNTQDQDDAQGAQNTQGTSGAQDSGEVQTESVEANADTQGVDAQTPEGSQPAQDGLSTTPAGVRLANGSFVTVDSDGNLLVADTSWNERVLDDTQPYTCEVTEGGEVVIRDSSGKAVEIDPQASIISYANKDGRQMKYDAGQNSTEITDSDGNVFVIDETEFNETATEVAADAMDSNAKEQNGQHMQQSVVPVVAVLVAIAVVVAVVLWRRAHMSRG